MVRVKDHSTDLRLVHHVYGRNSERVIDSFSISTNFAIAESEDSVSSRFVWYRLALRSRSSFENVMTTGSRMNSGKCLKFLATHPPRIHRQRFIKQLRAWSRTASVRDSEPIESNSIQAPDRKAVHIRQPLVELVSTRTRETALHKAAHKISRNTRGVVVPNRFRTEFARSTRLVDLFSATCGVSMISGRVLPWKSW